MLVDRFLDSFGGLVATVDDAGDGEAKAQENEHDNQDDDSNGHAGRCILGIGESIGVRFAVEAILILGFGGCSEQYHAEGEKCVVHFI